MAQRLETVGMIGIGKLGVPVASNLIQENFKVVGYRRTDIGAFAALGGRPMHSPAETAQQCDILLLCLPSEEASLEVIEGAQGILPHIKPGLIVVEMGTYRKAFKLQLADKLQKAGARVLEAEVSGSPPMVSARKAALYIGGNSAVLEEARPVLEAISPTLYHLGDYGCAVAMKLIANYLLSIHTLAAAEAMNMGTRAGFDPHVVAKVIQSGAGGSAMFGVRAPLMADRAFTPALGPFDTLEKYLELGRQMADELGCATPLFSAAEPYFHRALHSEIRQEDIAAVIKLVEEDSATQLAPTVGHKSA